MLLKVLGAIDVLTGLILVGLGLGAEIQKSILIICGVILIIKSSLGFLKDFASWIDFIAGAVFLIFILINIPEIILMIISMLIIQKGIFSFLD